MKNVLLYLLEKILILTRKNKQFVKMKIKIKKISYAFSEKIFCISLKETKFKSTHIYLTRYKKYAHTASKSDKKVICPDYREALFHF